METKDVVMIAFVVFCSLVGALWVMLNGRIADNKKRINGVSDKVGVQEVRLGRGDERLELLKEVRKEQKVMAKNINDIKLNCPKCKL